MFGLFKKKQPAPNGPDFSDIDSRDKAIAMFQRGELEKLHLMPLDFGGEDSEVNTLLVPLGVADVKRGIDNNVIRPLIEEGKVSQYSAAPEYQGDSFIPIAIQITASDPSDFTTTINIWGEALTRE